MLHNITDKYTKTVRGMEISVSIKAPAGANVQPILEKVEQLFKYAETDPDQLNLGFDDPDQG